MVLAPKFITQLRVFLLTIIILGTALQPILSVNNGVGFEELSVDQSVNLVGIDLTSALLVSELLQVILLSIKEIKQFFDVLELDEVIFVEIERFSGTALASLCLPKIELEILVNYTVAAVTGLLRLLLLGSGGCAGTVTLILQN